jgi:tRNA(Ile)-lysidine synthase
MAHNRPPRAAVRAAVRRALADLEPGDRVLVALSGGPDSLALLAGVVCVCVERGLVAAAIVIDHGIQPGSAGVAARAAEQARILGCPDVEVLAVQVPQLPGFGGIEAAARTVRYAALSRASEQSRAVAVLLGHTREDQAETVLLGLARGSGTRSLAGMAAVTGIYRRPLLDLPRELVARAAAELAQEDPRLTPWADPHNEDPTFARVRVRRDVLPTLERALGPGVAAALARTARLARADADALDAWADRVWAEIPSAPGRVEAPGIASSATDPTGATPSGAARAGAARSGAARSGAAPLGVARSGAAAHGAGPSAAAPHGTGPPGAAAPIAAWAALPVAVLSPSAGDPLPRAVVTRLVRRFLIGAGCPTGALTADHVERVADLIAAPRSRAEVALPGGLRTRREGDLLVVRA